MTDPKLILRTVLICILVLSAAMSFQSVAMAECDEVTAEFCDNLAQNTQSDELESYYTRIKQKISRNWNINNTNDTGNATASFFIHRDGSISELSIQTSSGNLDFDSAVLDTIRGAAPFDRLPESYLPDRLEFQITLAAQAAPALPASYMENVERKLSEIWNPETTDESKEVVVTFEINRDGTVNQLGILTSSGDDDFDSYALQAIAEASPFEPFPDDYPNDLLVINYTLATSAATRPTIPERLQTYDCLEVSEIESRGPDRIDLGNYRNNTILLEADVTNNCDIGFEVAAWRATIFPAGSNTELGGKTALAQSLMPGDSQSIIFYIKFGDLSWTNEYSPARIVSEGFSYSLSLSSATPMSE